MKHFRLLLIFVILKFNLAAFAQFYSSSFPPDTQKTLMEIPSYMGLTEMKIRVKVFPHTLSNDWRHGPRDNPSKFELISAQEGFSIGGVYFHHAKFSATSNTLIIKDDKQTIKVNKFPLIINLKSPTKILRYGNENKSHTYSGDLYISAAGNKAQIVNHIPLMTYIKGVVPSESSHTWPLEALKAQAVAARSYAVFHKLSAPSQRSYDVDDTARYQVYSGESHRFPSTDQAVEQTAGEIMTYNDKVIIAFFHAFSGGETDSGKNIFKMSTIPYCKGNKEVFANDELRSMISENIHWIIEWNKSWTRKSLLTTLKRKNKNFKTFNINSSYELEVSKRNTLYNGSIRELTFTQGNNQARIDYHTLRTNLGWSNFNSYHFFLDDSINNESLDFRGFGWGHHVGLSQWGAYVMASKYDYSYQQILSHYYSGINIKTL